MLLPLLWFLLATGNIHSDICLGNSKEEFEAVLFMLGKIQFVVFPVELTIFSTMNLVSVAFHLGFGAWYWYVLCHCQYQTSHRCVGRHRGLNRLRGVRDVVDRLAVHDANGLAEESLCQQRSSQIACA